MEKQSVKFLTLAELLQRSRPVTGALSLHPSRSGELKGRHQSSDTPSKPSGPTNPTKSQDHNPRILEAFNYPTILVGTLNLPNSDENSASSPVRRCLNSSCFQFSDGLSTVCCDILDLDVRIIGKTIKVLAWNFIPFKCGGGFLEIIRWDPTESAGNARQCTSSLQSFPLDSASYNICNGISKARHCVYGALESVSPVAVVPCTFGASSSKSVPGVISDGSSHLCGFLAQILVCTLCRSKDFTEKQCSHHFTDPVIVYFCGPAVSWHPVISRLIWKVISVSGLKKKLVFLGKEESKLMYLTTEDALLHLPDLLNHRTPSLMTGIRGNVEHCTYTGTVTGVYMQGAVVELDQQVLLILTDKQLYVPHSLRVGAIVSVQNVHLVKPQFSWTKIVGLGVCVKTTISVTSFSSMETGCHMYSKSQSLLAKFVDSLEFSARLWVLLLVACLRRKFTGILSEKEILGSKRKEGFAQTYASSHLPSVVYQFQHGVFKDYCKHDFCGRYSELNYYHFKLVVPIANFINYCEVTWMKMMLERETDCGIMINCNQDSLPSCDGKYCSQTIRRILQSEDIGIILLGNLKVSSSSGRLQLVDATGNIDVVIPDLHSTWNCNGIFEVNKFSIIMEATSKLVVHLRLLPNEAFSCRSIFSGVSSGRTLKMTNYLYYHLQDQLYKNKPIFPIMNKKRNFEELQSGMFHLLRITHKFPMLQKFQGYRGNSNRSSIFAEAVLLPWDLFVIEKDEEEPTNEFSIEHLVQPTDDYGSKTYLENITSKRCKVDPATSRSDGSFLNDGGNALYGEKCCDLNFPLKIPCSFTARDIDGQCLIHSGFLQRKDSTDSKICRKAGAEKIVLEFTSENFCFYELLKIGGYYMTKHHGEESLCGINDFNDVTSGKVVITSKTLMWSFSFSHHDVFPNTIPSETPVLSNPFIISNVQCERNSHQTELPFLVLNSECPDTFSTIILFLSGGAMHLLEDNLKEIEKVMTKSSVSLEELANFPLCSTIAKTSLKQSSAIVDSGCLLPEGNLMTLQGHILAVCDTSSDPLAAHSSPEGSFNSPKPKYLHGIARSVCIRIFVDNRIVNVFGSFSKHACPIGFEAGANATFHRILILRGQNEFMLTPASFIEINSIRVLNDQCNNEDNNSLVVSRLVNFSSMHTVPTMFIADIVQCSEQKQVHLYCRVVGIYVLVLENREGALPYQRIYSSVPSVEVTLAGFLLDDGSSTCCCWTNSERAATLLRLREGFADETSDGSIWRSKKARTDEACGFTVSHLDKILKQHRRIVVKNYGSMFDSSSQDLAFFAGSDDAIVSSDEDLLKFIIFNACFSTFWVTGCMMGSKGIGQFEKKLMELEMTTPPILNLWATEVCPGDPLSEARSIMQELSNT